MPEITIGQPCCPHCQSIDLSENNIVHVRLRVTKWTAPEHPDDDPEPNDFGPWEPVDDTIQTVADEAPRWYCNACSQEFELFARVQAAA